MGDFFCAILYIISLLVIVLLAYSHKGRNKEDTKDSSTVQPPKPTLEWLEPEHGIFNIEGIKAFLGLGKQRHISHHFEPFIARHTTYESLLLAIRNSRIKAVDVIVGIDFSASNELQGRKTFNRHSLHRISSNVLSHLSSGIGLADVNSYSDKYRLNPYQRAIAALDEIWTHQLHLASYYHAFGFGAVSSKETGLTSLKIDDNSFVSFGEILETYSRFASQLSPSGPSDFSFIINKAVEYVKKTKSYHVLFILTDGQITRKNTVKNTANAVVEASKFPLSIVVIGLGDGPFTLIEEMDRNLPQRVFDNLHFCHFSTAFANAKSKFSREVFILDALMEIPDQYRKIRSLGYLDFFSSTKSPLHQNSVVSLPLAQSRSDDDGGSSHKAKSFHSTHKMVVAEEHVNNEKNDNLRYRSCHL